MVKIGERIKKIRKGKGITQKHVERCLGKYDGWMWGVENGKIELYAKDLDLLAETLEINISDLFYPAIDVLA